MPDQVPHESRTADGVFSGGGVKGLAFAGALTAADNFGYRDWHELAGTSAGAITAMALASGYNATALKESLDRFDFSTIADYGTPIHLLGGIRDVIFHESIVKGDALTNWIRDLLIHAPNGGLDPDITFTELEGKTGRTLVVVGSDVAHGRIVAFPKDLELYVDDDSDTVDASNYPVYKAVRISAGYPYFFPPVGGLRDKHTEQQGVFVDGGVGSAFPLYIFDKPEPKHPTWGFHLHGGHDLHETDPTHHNVGGVTWPVQMLEAVLDTSMNALDKFEQQRFEGRVIAIPTGSVSTLNFNLDKGEKDELFKSGFDATTTFFENPPAPPENSYGKIP